MNHSCNNGNGGAFNLLKYDLVEIKNSYFSSNKASLGGAIYIKTESNNSQFNINNKEIT